MTGGTPSASRGQSVPLGDVLTYLRGCQPVPELARQVPRTALPDVDDWRFDAASGPPDPEIVAHAWHRIERDGWTIVASHTRPYAYTAGLTPQGWPELVIRLRATPTEIAGALLCEVKQWFEAEGRTPRVGDSMTVARFAVRLLAIDERLVAPVCAVAHALYGGTPVRAVEVVVRLHDAGNSL